MSDASCDNLEGCHCQVTKCEEDEEDDEDGEDELVHCRPASTKTRVVKPSQHHQGSAIARLAKLISLDLQRYFREICKKIAIARIPKCRKEPAHASPRTKRQGITVALSPRNASAMKTMKTVSQHQDGRGEEAPSPDHQKNARLMKSVPYVSLGATTAVRT